MDMVIKLSETRTGAAIPQRSQEDRDTITSAKEYIMKLCGITEPEAHRMLQRKSMETSSRMVDVARSVLCAAGTLRQ